jgi:pimeloyl-ACP methyl ester carboxylesterase
VLEDVTHRRVRLPGSGIEIALLDWGGDGPLALLHHANGFCAGVWGLVAELLRPRFRVVAMDARGHGESSKPEDPESYAWLRFAEDVAAVAHALSAERGTRSVDVGVGHSFGGTAIVTAAAHAPDLFGRIVLVDPIVPPPASSGLDPGRSERSGQLVEGARKRRFEWESRAAARAWWGEKSLFRDWDPRALDLYAAEGLVERPDGSVELECRPETEAAIFAASGAHDVWSLAERVEAPTLVLRAGRSEFPRTVHETFTARLREGTLQELPAGHLVPMERPQLVADAVLAFAGPTDQRSTG